MNNEIEYSVHEEARNKDGEVIPGKEIGKYVSKTMLAPTMTISVGQKKHRIRCIDFNSDTGVRKIIIDPTKRGK